MSKFVDNLENFPHSFIVRVTKENVETYKEFLRTEEDYINIKTKENYTIVIEVHTFQIEC